MIAAVTGATGFVGGHLAAALARRGDTVTCLARSEAKADSIRRSGCRAVIGSLGDPDALLRLVEGTEIVYHVAGVVAANAEREFYRVNRGGTERLLRAARDARVRRAVYVSSLAATGPNPRGYPSGDGTPAAPVTMYGKSKLAGEDAVQQSGVPFTIVRPPTVYGPGDRELLKVFRLAKLGIVPLMGDGEQELSLIYVDDLVDALIAAGTTERTEGHVYHAAHPEVVTQRQLVETIAHAVGSSPRITTISEKTTRRALGVAGSLARLVRVTTLLTADKANEFLAPAWTCSSDRLARDAGWTAAVGVRDGAERTAAWYRNRKWL